MKYHVLLLWSGISLSIGVIGYDYIKEETLWVGVVLLGIAFLLLGTACWKKEKALFLGAALCFFCLIGMGRMYVSDEALQNESSWVVGSEGTYEAVIIEPPLMDKEEGAYTRYLVDLEKIRYADGIEKTLHGTAYLYESGVEHSHFLGERISVLGQMTAIRNYKNPGKMNLEGRYRSRHLLGRIYLPEGVSIDSLGDSGTCMPMRLAETIKGHVFDSFLPYMDEKRLHILMTLLFGGNYNDISPSIMNSFSATGIVHILSVSGSHIALLFGFLYFLGKWIGLPHKAVLISSIGVVLFYALLAGFVPPVIRATAMGILTVGGVFLEREKTTLNLLGAVVAGMVLWDPFYLYDVSFQLSVGASAGILLFYRSILGSLKKLFSVPFWILEATSLAISAQLLTIPIILYDFHVFPLYFIPANLLVAPFLEWTIIAGLLAAALSIICMPLAGGILYVADYGLWIALRLNMALASLPKASVGIGGMTAWQSIWYYLTLGMIYFHRSWLSFSRKRLVVASIWGIFSLWIGFLYVTAPKLLVYCPDLGPDQGMVLVHGNQKILYYKGGGVVSHRSAWEWNSFLGYEGIFAADILILNVEDVLHTIPFTLSVPVKEIWVTGGSWKDKVPKLQDTYEAPIRQLGKAKLAMGDILYHTNGSSWIIGNDVWNIYIQGKKSISPLDVHPHRLWLVGQGGYKELTTKDMEQVVPEMVVYYGNRLQHSWENMELFTLYPIEARNTYLDGMQEITFNNEWHLR